jgi:peptidoglycan/LPS O-acetylase OafA/YrhL
MPYQFNGVNMQKLRYVDALRGLAITGVLIVHCGQIGSCERFLPSLFQTIVNYGQLGVQMFYVVSAFTLFLSFSRSMGVEKAPVRNFFIRRFFRIAPIYYLGICYYLWLYSKGPTYSPYWLGNTSNISTGNIVSNFLFLHGFSPYWIKSLVPGGGTIAVLMMFYCLVPLLVLYITNKRQAVNFLLAVLVARLALEVLLSKVPLIPNAILWGKYLRLYLPNQMPVFALGILMFFLISEEHEESDRAAIRPLSLMISAILLIAQFGLGIQVLPPHVMCGMAFVVLGIAMGRREFAVLVNPVFVHLGRVSYSMYMVHFAVLYWLFKLGGGDYLPVTDSSSAMINYLIRLCILIPTTVGVATMLYWLVEKPSQRFGRKLVAALEQQQPRAQKVGRQRLLDPAAAGDTSD